MQGEIREAWHKLPCALPLFRRERVGDVLFYAPGNVVSVPSGQAQSFANALVRAEPGNSLVDELRTQAQRAEQTWNAATTSPFAPVCLTLYLHNNCNLACTYCYADPGRRGSPRLSVRAVRAAADMVAANCRARGVPCTVVFHGGGEPSLDRTLADLLLNAVEERAARYGVPLFRYVATNGVMSARRAAWLERFDRIGLSCDGPAPVQNRQRPLANGAPTLSIVERTAAIVHKPLHVRATITAEWVDRQPEIAGALCRQLAPDEIHVEPVYAVGRAARPGAGAWMWPEGENRQLAKRFVASFLAARSVARSYGVRWLTSLARPSEIHGPYCQVFRNVLQLVPGDTAVACFCETGAQPRTSGAPTTHALENAGMLTVGRYDAASDEWQLDQAHILELQRRLRVEPSRCIDCFNRYHCARECPDRCALEERSDGPGLRCLVSQELADAELQERAAQRRC